MTVDELNTKMEDEFAAVRKDMDAGFAAVRTEMQAGFSAVRTELKAEIKAEGETTRRHFDVMVEQMKDVVKVVADGTARNTERLNDHERRLTAIEKQRH